jgi:hypothetical protein
VIAFGGQAGPDRSNDVLMAAGPGYSGMGMDRLKLSNDDLDSQIAGAQAFLNGMNRKGAGSASPASASGGGSAALPTAATKLAFIRTTRNLLSTTASPTVPIGSN